MATGIVMLFSSEEEGRAVVLVREEFDRVMDAAVPLQQPSSALEARERTTFTLLGGDRVFVRPDQIVRVVENYEES